MNKLSLMALVLTRVEVSVVYLRGGLILALIDKSSNLFLHRQVFGLKIKFTKARVGWVLEPQLRIMDSNHFL